ncbi:hypothetical protein ZWY2020_052506 [Hordeum vulgare]|nr:hypothetical protein ZWY2020_052506 [Hordeum vulgare]
MVSSNDATSIRVDSAVKENRAGEDRLATLIEENLQPILIKHFEDLAKKNLPTKESYASPRKESDDPMSLSPPTIIPEDAWSSTVGDVATCSYSTITGFTDYTLE